MGEFGNIQFSCIDTYGGFGLFNAAFWSKSITRHRSIPLPAPITEGLALKTIQDHDVLARIFFDKTFAKILQPMTQTDAGQASAYMVKGTEALEEIHLHTDGDSLILRQSMGYSLDLTMKWQVVRDPGYRDDVISGKDAFSDKQSAIPNLALHEWVEIRGFRPLMGLLRMRIPESISPRAHAILFVAETKLQDPVLSVDEVVQVVRDRLKALQEIYAGKNELNL